MSYINDALRKAQKEKESHYRAYGDIIGAVSKDARRSSRTILFSGLLVLFILIVGGIVYLYSLINEKRLVTAQAPIAIQQPTESSPADLSIAVAPSGSNAATINPGAPVSGKNAQPVKEKLKVADVQALFARAVAKQAEGKLGEARELYAVVISNSPGHVQAKNNLGVIYMNQKNYKAAEKLFKEVLAMKPKYVDAHYNLACLYAQKKEYARSIHFLKAAIGINPEVRNWAKNDNDLKELSKYPDFNNLMEGQGN
jgi:tetratricopeptide (TPR) repeat protein